MILNNKQSGVSFFKDASLSNLIYGVIILSLIIFIAWPIIEVWISSIYVDGQINFSNYQQLFVRNSQLLWNSIFVSTLSTILAVSLGLCLALYITHSNNCGKKIVLGVLLLTMISPPFVSSISYIMLFGKRGLITYNLLNLSINPYGWHGVVLMQSIGHTSLAALLIMGILKGVDRNLESAAYDSGASSWATLIQITIPLAKPGILVAALVTFIKSLSDFGTPIIIGGKFNVLATEAYLNVIGLYNLPKAAAMSTLLVVPALLAFIIYRKILGNTKFFSSKSTNQNNGELKLSKPINLILAIITWLFVLFMFIKYGTILWGAFAKTWGVDFSLTLNHIKNLNLRKLRSLGRSFKYSLIVGILGSLIGILLSYILERKEFIGTKVLDFIATLPYMIPGTFFGIGYLLAFNDQPLVLTGTGLIVVLNCVFRQLPISTKAGTAVLSQLNPELESSARDLGAKEGYVFKDIVLPNLKPAFLVSFINNFTTTMITIGAIIFLITSSSKVATVEMFGAIKTGDIGIAAVFANLIIITVLIINITFSWFCLRKKNDKIKDQKNYISKLEINKI
ncbi:MAG: ABC transporter permease [Bacillota bacterium]